MKVIVIGANGTIGKHVTKALKSAGHEVITAGRNRGDYQVNIENPECVTNLYKKVGAFDAVVNASGDVAFAPLTDLKQEQWDVGFKSKLMGQINIVQQALPYIKEGGSFTLISGILGDENIAAGTAAATVNKAIEGFAKSAAQELPKRLRINVVSPTLLEDSLQSYGPFFPGFIPTNGAAVAQAFTKSVMGIQTGHVFQVR